VGRFKYAPFVYTNFRMAVDPGSLGALLKTLNVKQRLDLASHGVDVLRASAGNKQTTRYEDFAKAIGLMARTDIFTVQHRDQVIAILSVMAAVERDGRGGKDRNVGPLEFDWIVNKQGKPGAGIAKNSRIVRKP
jgi:hypothetical protein